MTKNTTLLLLGAIVIAIAATAYFFFLRPVNIYVAIPDSAIAIIKIDDWKDFNEKLAGTRTGSSLQKTEMAGRLAKELSAMQQLFAGNDALKLAGSGKTVVSVHLVSANDYGFLFTTSVRGVSDTKLLQYIQSLKNIKVQVRTFKRQKVLDVVLADGRTVTFARQRGILSFSFTSFLAENTVTAISSGKNIENESTFRQALRKLPAGNDFGLFINFKKADVLLPVAIKETKVPLLKDISDFADWGAYGITLADNEIRISGTAVSASDKDKPSADKDLLSNNLLNHIPDNAAYVHISLNDPDPAKKQFESFRNWMGDARAFVVLEPLKQDYFEQSAFIIQTRDKNKALKDLNKLAVSGGASEAPVEIFMDAPVFNLKNGSRLSEIFNTRFVTFGNSYFSAVNDAVIVCNNIDVLKLWIEKAANGESLVKDEAFKRMTQGTSAKGGDFIYINPQRAELLFRGLIKENSSMEVYLSSFSGMVIGSGFTNEFTQTSAIFKTSAQEKALTGLVWKTRLKTASFYPPQVVLNINTGEKEIIAQDTSGNMYLLSKSGEILFTRNIGEQIISSVYQLDYYHNGKLQYIFNTSQNVYVVDRFGNDVASYPLKLSYPAVTGMTLVYDSISRLFSYYIPCANGAVYGYQSTGRPLYGWSPRNNTGLFNQPLQLITQNKVNRLLGFNTSGKLLLFEAKGNSKWVIANLPGMPQDFSIVQQRNDFVMLNAWEKQLFEISFDGNDQVKPLLDNAGYFVATATSDSTYLYFFSSENSIRAYDESGNFKTSAGLKDAHITGLQLVNTYGIPHVAVRDEVAERITLYNIELQAGAGFSTRNIAAYSLHDLFDRKEMILLATDSTGSIFCSRVK